MPILQSAFPSLLHSAALIGSGSELMGFDTEMSTDHHSGPRVLLFLTEDDHARHAAAIDETLRRRLPHTFYGYRPTSAPPTPKIMGRSYCRRLTPGRTTIGSSY